MDTCSLRLDLEAKIAKYREKLDDAETKLAEVEGWWRSEPRSSPLSRQLENLRASVMNYRTLLSTTRRDLEQLGD